MLIVRPERGAGRDVEAIIGDATYCEIGLDPAARIQQLRVCERAHRFVDVVRANPLQRRERIFAHDLQLAERSLVEQRTARARRAMLFANMREPILAAKAIDVFALHALGGEPIRALPTDLLAE